MAITRDSSGAAAISTTNDLTWAHTCSGTNRLLFVNVYQNNGEGNNITVTYAGVSMTSIANASSTDGQSSHLFYLFAPTSGANNVVIHCSSGNTPMGGVSSSYKGVLQAGTMDATNTQSVSATSVTATVTTVADNCWAVLGGVGFNALTASTGSNLVNSADGTVGIFDTNAALTPAGSHSMAVTTNNANLGVVMASFAPVVLSLTMGQGSYTLTGQNAALSYGRKVVLAVGTYTYTGFSVALSYFQKWFRQVLNISSMTNGTKNSSIWTEDSKNSSSADNQTKN